MKSSLEIKFYLAIFFLFFCSPCRGCVEFGHFFGMGYEYGQSFNKEREKRGIPILPEGWMVNVDGESITWTDPEFYLNGIEWGDGATLPSPRHYQKILLIQNGVFIERDVYLGKITGTRYKGGEAIPVFETIHITHTYYYDEIDNISCSADVRTTDIEFINGQCQKAVDILERWGLTYP